MEEKIIELEFPLNIKIGPVEISSHLLFEIAAYAIGFRYFLYLRKNTHDKISTDHRTILFIAAAAGALLFSRAIGMLESSDLFTDRFNMAMVFGNKTILGGLFGGLLAVELCKKIIGVKNSSGDLITFPLLLGMIIGRIGCFFSGLEDGTYGIASTLPWAIDFGDDIYRHPTNLYEILFLLLTGFSIFLLENKYELSDGSRFKIFLLGYFIFRFLVEFIKPVYKIGFGLSSIQLTSLAGIVYYYKVLLYPRSLIKEVIHA